MNDEYVNKIIHFSDITDNPCDLYKNSQKHYTLKNKYYKCLGETKVWLAYVGIEASKCDFLVFQSVKDTSSILVLPKFVLENDLNDITFGFFDKKTKDIIKQNLYRNYKYGCKIGDFYLLVDHNQILFTYNNKKYYASNEPRIPNVYDIGHVMTIKEYDDYEIRKKLYMNHLMGGVK